MDSKSLPPLSSPDLPQHAKQSVRPSSLCVYSTVHQVLEAVLLQLL